MGTGFQMRIRHWHRLTITQQWLGCVSVAAPPSELGRLCSLPPSLAPPLDLACQQGCSGQVVCSQCSFEYKPLAPALGADIADIVAAPAVPHPEYNVDGI